MIRIAQHQQQQQPQQHPTTLIHQHRTIDSEVQIVQLHVALEQAMKDQTTSSYTLSRTTTRSVSTSSAAPSTLDLDEQPLSGAVTPRKSRAERSLLSVLERQGRVPGQSPPPPATRTHPYRSPSAAATSGGTSINNINNTTFGLGLTTGGPAPLPPVTPSPTMSRTASNRSRPGSRAGSRSRSHAVSPVAGQSGESMARDRSGGGGEVDLTSLVQRSIALQNSPPPPTPPASPPRCARRPHFSTSPTTARTTFEPCDSSTSHESMSEDPPRVGLGMGRLPEWVPRPRSPRRSPSPDVKMRNPPPPNRPTHGRTQSSGSARSLQLQQGATPPSGTTSPRTRPASGSVSSAASVPLAAPNPRRRVAGAAAVALLGEMQAGVPSGNGGGGGVQYTPNNNNITTSPTSNLAPPGLLSGETPANSIAVRYRRATATLPVRLPTIPATPVDNSFLSPHTYPSAATMQYQHTANTSTSRGLLEVPQASPLSPRQAYKREVRSGPQSPRPISGPVLAPAGEVDVTMVFDVEAASRQLQNAPGWVSFDDVALPPPEMDDDSADADDDDDEMDGAKKRPRTNRRWSLW